MFLKIEEARQLGIRYRQSRGVTKSASILQDSVDFAEGKSYDIFLSHSFADADIVLGVYAFLTTAGKTVYVDWIEDKGLDRTKVTSETADILRRRMRASSSLVYASSEKAAQSRWMPWELGYFDGFKPNMVSILPLVSASDSEWTGQEYLGLYPVVDQLLLSGVHTPFIVRKDKTAQQLKNFGNSGTGFNWKDQYGRAV